MNDSSKAKGRVAFLVGHRDWGKSRTLVSLTGGQHRSVTIDDVRFYIRRMSNDDYSEHYLNFIRRLSVDVTPNLIAAFCPNFVQPEVRSLEVLRLLRDNYRLHFWVMRYKFGTTLRISQDEIAELENHGTVSVFEDHAEAPIRAEAFRRFVSEVVLNHE